MSLISVEHQWNIELILNFQEIEDACRSYVGVITKKTLEDGRRINKTVEEQVPQNTVPFFFLPKTVEIHESPRPRVHKQAQGNVASMRILVSHPTQVM